MQAPGDVIVVNLRSGSLQAEANPQAASANLQVDLGDIGNIAGNARVSGLTTTQGIAGQVRATIEDLALVSAFAPQVQDVQGGVTANLDLSGTLTAPAVRGEVRVADAGAEIPEAAIEIKDVQLTVAGDGQEALQITGSARSGPGRLELSGRFQPSTLQVVMNIEGQEFQAFNTSEIQVLISPDLDLAIGQGQVRIEGQVLVPKAFISPPKGVASGGVSVSDDVVIVRGDEEPDPAIQEETGLAVYARIRVILGEDVSVAVPGFTAQLAGDLLVEQTPQFPPRGTGTIEVQSGQYRVYGQELQIERGRLLFGGGPVANPGLDLRVARQIEDVTAGALIQGTVKNPRLTLFSEPAMPDTSILSYLLFGRPPNARSGSENAMLLQAATALGFSGGNLVTKRLSEAFGLDYFRFESGDALEESALVIGKYLTPELYVSYGIGVFEAVNTFTMRYRINKRLSLESSSGTESSADLIYTIER